MMTKPWKTLQLNHSRGEQYHISRAIGNSLFNSEYKIPVTLCFTTAGFTGTRIIFEDDHLGRLQKGLSYWGLFIKDKERIARDFELYILQLKDKMNKRAIVRFKLIVDRSKEMCSFKAEFREFDGFKVESLVVESLRVDNWRQDVPSFLKVPHDELTSSFLEQNHHLDEVIVNRENGQLIEASKSSLVLMDDQGRMVFTKSPRKLESISENRLKAFFKDRKIGYCEREVYLGDLSDFEGAWLVNAVRGMRSICQINGIKIRQKTPCWFDEWGESFR